MPMPLEYCNGRFLKTFCTLKLIMVPVVQRKNQRHQSGDMTNHVVSFVFFPDFSGKCMHIFYARDA